MMPHTSFLPSCSLFATGLTAAAKTKDANGVRDYTKKAAAALDEVILIGKANKL